MRILINLPKSHRKVDRFKNKFPNASFYGMTNLGSGRKSYLIPIVDYEANKVWINELGATKAKEQPRL